MTTLQAGRAVQRDDSTSLPIGLWLIGLAMLLIRSAEVFYVPIMPLYARLLDAGVPLFLIGLVTSIDVMLVVVVVAGLLAPLVELAWLASLARRLPLADALALGARRYFAAWRVTFLLAPGFGIAAALLVLGPLGASVLTSSVVDERAHDLCILAAMLPALALGLVLFVWHDLARAALATSSRSALGAVLRTAGLALRGPAVLVYLATSALALLLGLVGHVLGAHLDHGFGAAILVLALTQSLALARTFCRALWLSDAVVRVSL